MARNVERHRASPIITGDKEIVTTKILKRTQIDESDESDEPSPTFYKGRRTGTKSATRASFFAGWLSALAPGHSRAQARSCASLRLDRHRSAGCGSNCDSS